MKGTPGLSRLRIGLGLQVKAVAADSGIDRPLLSKIESGRVNPSAEEVRKIAKALGVPETEVLSCLKMQGSKIWKKRRV